MNIRIIFTLFIIVCWYVKESHGFEPCPPNVQSKVIHVCIDNKLNDLINVFVSTRLTPLQQAVECTCFITPSNSYENYTLAVQGASAYHDNNTNVSFSFNDVVIRNSTNFGLYSTMNLTGETVLKYSSPNDDTVQVCLYISAKTDQDKFNIECLTNQIYHSTDSTTIPTTRISKTDSTSVTQTSKKDITINTEPTTLSTTTRNHDTKSSTETFNMTSKSQNNNGISEDNRVIIAAIVGAISGMVLIILAVVAVVYCKRKRRSMSNEASQPTSSSTTYHGDNPGIQVNQAYESLNDDQPNQTPYDTLVVSQDTLNDNTSPTLNYENMKVDNTCQEVSADNSESYYNLPGHQAAHSEDSHNVESVEKGTVTYENTKVDATWHEEKINK